MGAKNEPKVFFRTRMGGRLGGSKDPRLRQKGVPLSDLSDKRGPCLKAQEPTGRGRRADSELQKEDVSIRLPLDYTPTLDLEECKGEWKGQLMFERPNGSP